MMHSEVKVVAVNEHISAEEHRIDSVRALQLQWISLRKRGCIDAKAFFHKEGVRREEAWHGRRVQRATERISIL